MIYFDWYIQALGGLIGLVTCVYFYLTGDIVLYTNLASNYNLITFNRVIASCLLYPLCFLTFLLSFIRCIKGDIFSKYINFIKFNNTILYCTVIIGIIGGGFIFIIPSIFILYYPIKSAIVNFSYNRKDKSSSNDDSTTQSKEFSTNEYSTIKYSNNKEYHLDKLRLFNTKKEIAYDLLNKDADIDFITDLTGFSQEELEKLKKQNNQ